MGRTDLDRVFARCRSVEDVVLTAVGAGAFCWDDPPVGRLNGDAVTEVGLRAVGRLTELNSTTGTGGT